MNTELSSADLRWQRLFDSQSTGGELSSAELEFLIAHAPRAPELTAERALWAGMGDLFRDSGDDSGAHEQSGGHDRSNQLSASERDVVRSAVDLFLAGTSADDGANVELSGTGQDAAIVPFPERPCDRVNESAQGSDSSQEVSAESSDSARERSTTDLTHVLRLPAALSRVKIPEAKTRMPWAVGVAAVAMVSLAFMAGRWSAHSSRSTWAHSSTGVSGLQASVASSHDAAAGRGVGLDAKPHADTPSEVDRPSQTLTPAIVSGAGMLDGRPLAAADFLGDASREIEVAEGLCLGTEQGQFCAQAGSRLRWHGGHASLELLAGRGDYSLQADRPASDGALVQGASEAGGRRTPSSDGPSGSKAGKKQGSAAHTRKAAAYANTDAAEPSGSHPRIERLQVVVAGVRVETGNSGGSYALRAPTPEHQIDSWRLEVREGDVHVRDDAGATVARLSAGDSLHGRARGAASQKPRLGPTGPTGSTSAVDAELASHQGRAKSRRAPESAIARELARARGLRGAKKFRAAARSYEKVLKRYPESPRARTAWVSLGQLYAGPLERSKAALRAFDSYLSSGGGPLAEEARLGQISALRSLESTRRERRAIEGFLATYPNSSYADALRTRLENMSRRR